MANKTKATAIVATKETKKVATKKVEAKVSAPKKVEKAETQKENSSKKDTALSMDEVMKLFAENKIVIKNPGAKGAYRIMKGGSSLNLRRSQYVIYTTDADYEALEKAKLGDKVTLEKGTNSSDKVRPNVVKIGDTDTLKAALKVYASNSANVAA